MLNLLRNNILLRQSRLHINSFSTIPSLLNTHFNKLPYKEILQTERGPNKWDYSEVMEATDALACGFIELLCNNGIGKIALWLPADAVERPLTQLAASKIGMTVIDIDINMTKSSDIFKILKESDVTGIIYEPKIGYSSLEMRAEDEKSTGILMDAIPGLRGFDEKMGVPFRSRQLPNFKKAIHTGYWGLPPMTSFKGMFINLPFPNPIPQYQDNVTDSTPLALNYIYDEKDGYKKSKIYTQKDILSDKDNIWPIVRGISNREYQIIPASEESKAMIPDELKN